MSSNTTMSDLDFEKETVYLAYRDIFKGELAKLRKRAKVRNVVEKHKDHLHHKQLADSVDSEKVCSILGDLLTGNMFESDSIAKDAFPTLFSPRNGTALIVKCVEDDFETETRRGSENPPNASPSPHTLHSPNIPMPKSISSERGSTGTQHRIDQKTSGIRKPARTRRKLAGLVIHTGEEQEIKHKEVIYGDREQGRIVLERIPGYSSLSTDPTYLPFKLQHSILTQTQRLLEECCYDFAERWFPSILESNSWDAPEAVELSKWWMALRKYDIPAAAISLSPGQSLAVLFKRATSIRHCAVHRRPQIPVKIVEQMVRDAWLLSQALKDDSRAAQLQHWHKELEDLVTHLQLRTDSQREVAEAELRNIQSSKSELEEKLAELESRASQLTHFLEVESRAHRAIDIEALQSLDQALSRPAPVKALPAIALNQAWRWIGKVWTW